MIRADNLYFSYTGAPPYVLEGIDLEIKDGEYLSVVGENGCGKSTLLRLILQFIKPTRGSIVSEAKRTGYVPQKRDAASSGFPITVYEMMNSYRKLLKIKERDVIFENLAQVGLTDFADALMGTLSGGQSQKALIARALMGNPDLLILDEPSAGVDINSQTEIYGFIQGLNKKYGITVVSVEHNLDAAISNSTQIYHLAGGDGHICTPQQYAAEILSFKNIRKRDDDIA